MKVLILEGYHARLKFSLYDQETSDLQAFGVADNIGMSKTRVAVHVREAGRVTKHAEFVELIDLSQALDKVLRMLQDEYINVLGDRSEIVAVGYKLTHGGTHFPGPIEINSEVRKQIKKLVPLAPEYLEPQLKLINAGRRTLSQSYQVAMFDTSFHLSMPAESFYYSIPRKLDKHQLLRKYGAHGLAHESMMELTAATLQGSTESLNIVSIYLENNCSISAIKEGRSIDCTSGLSPMSGISAGSFIGDIDPSVIDYLLREGKVKLKELNDFVKFEAGLTTTTSKYLLEDVLVEASRDLKDVHFALSKLAYDIRKQIGAYLAVLGNVSAVVISKGFPHGEILRSMIFSDLQELGIVYSADREVNELQGVNFISDPSSKIPVLHVDPDEHGAIAHEIIHALNMSLAN